jgi:dolichyl-phosphate-mannose--protein O-mannosyl transferase
MQNEEIFFTALYTALSLFTRLWKIGAADYVVWDEAHFGKFGSHYINRDFYFDVHPPLGKMLVGLVGVLSGYGGGFDFKSGAPYGDKVPYTTMRVLMAMFGVGMVPVAWWTAGELGWSRQSRHLVTLCVLFGASPLFRISSSAVEHEVANLTLYVSLSSSRCRLVMHLAIHPARLDALVFHIYNHPRAR